MELADDSLDGGGGGGFGGGGGGFGGGSSDGSVSGGGFSGVTLAPAPAPAPTISPALTSTPAPVPVPVSSSGGGASDGGFGLGSGFSINLPGVSDVTSTMNSLVSAGSGVTSDLSSQLLDGSAFAGIGSDVAAANGSMQDGLSSGLSQTMGLLGTLNTNVQASADSYGQMDSAIADGFGGLGSGDATGTLLADAGGTDAADPFQPAAATQPSIPAAGTAPGTVNSWWNGLTPGQQQQITDANPAAIGALDGIPAGVRDYANQQVLGGLISQTQAQITSLQNTPPPVVPGDETGMAGILSQQQQISDLQTKLGGLQALQQQIGPWNGFPDAASQAANPNGNFLLGVDTNNLGHSIVAVNNPDYADNVATLVPGVNTRLDAGSVNAYIGDAGNLVNSANAADPTAQNSAIAWMNYNAPQGVPAAVSSAPAIQGAPSLNQFQDGLYDTNTNGFGLNTTVIGHSYGSVLVGEATQQPGGLDANNVVAIGSPGMDVNSASNLLAGMRQQDALTSQAPQVFASRDSNDVIVWSEGFHNTDPATPGFGAQVFNSGDGPAGSFWTGGTSVAAHGYYFVPGSPGMQNMGQIITGNYQNVTAPPPPAAAPPVVMPIAP